MIEWNVKFTLRTIWVLESMYLAGEITFEEMMQMEEEFC